MRFAFLNEKEMKSHYSPVAITFILLSCFLLAFMRYADQTFFNLASQANLAEISAGQLAETKGNAKVKSLGKQMVTDHTTAQNELVALAKKEAVTIPMSPDADHKQALSDLNKLSGKSFDSAYISSQLADHKTAVALFSEESVNGSDTGAKAFATKYLPKLKMHLQMFQGTIKK
jgi:putative membrane protein